MTETSKKNTVCFSSILIPNNVMQDIEKVCKNEMNVINFFSRDFVYCVVIGTEDELTEIEVDDYYDCFFEDCTSLTKNNLTLFIEEEKLHNVLVEMNNLNKNEMRIFYYYHILIQVAACFNNKGLFFKRIDYKDPSETKIIKTCFYCSNSEFLFNESNFNELNLKLKIKIDSLSKQKTKERKRDPIESRLRHEVFKRDFYKCIECGKNKEETTLHVDHVIPFSRGGKDELENLRTLCQACNLAKSDKVF